MKDIQINTFQNGMQKDLGPTMPQEGAYTHAENIRIISDGSVGENAIVVSVDGNSLKLTLRYYFAGVGYEVDGNGYMQPTGALGDVHIIGNTVIRNTLVVFGVAKVKTTVNGVVTDFETSVIYKIDLNTYEKTLVYEEEDLNFNEDYPIQAVGRYENVDIQRVYWTDNLNAAKTINIAAENFDLTAQDLELSTYVDFLSPKVVSINSSGELPAGAYQYAYRLSSNEGAVTRFSPLSGLINILNGSEYWQYNEDPESQSEYSNTTPGETTDKAVTIEIENIDLDYDFIELAAVYKQSSEGVTAAYIVKKVKLTSGKTSIKHVNAIGETILIEEVTEITDEPSTAKTIETKDNRLFLGNLTYSSFNLEFNARAYSYRRKDNIRYPIYSVNTSYVDTETYTTGDASDQEILEEDLDALNPYNLHGEEQEETQDRYKYWPNGITLGGVGPNVSYKFIKKKLQGNDSYDIPTSPPFVKSSFRGAGCDLEDTEKGDYKSPLNASEFVGYQRDEIYRFGIVLYDLKGNPGFVNWVADIRFPDYQDYDHEGSYNGGLYNFTLSQTSNTGSGTNYNFSDSPSGMLDTEEAYTYSSPGGYDPNNEGLSSYDFENENFNEAANNKLYALGIKFLVNIPEEIQDKISGYRIVRVERTESDKTVLGSGIINFLHRQFASSGENNVTDYFTKSLFDDNDNAVDLGYRGAPDLFTIDSPDFPFLQNYPESSGGCNYLKIAGGLTGRRESDFTTDVGGAGVGDATIFTSHTLARTTSSLFTTFPIDYSTKLGRGEEGIIVPGESVNDSQVYRGVSNISVGKMNANGGLQAGNAIGEFGNINSIGEETLLVKGSGIAIANYYEQGGINELSQSIQVYNSDVARTGKFKLLALIKQELNGAQYGGNSYEDRKNNTYIPASEIVNINSDSNLDSNGALDVWGGDTYVVMYDIEKLRRHDTDLDSGTGSGSDRKSVNFAFPVETTVNTTLRGGWHFANKQDWETESQTLLNTFDLATCYYAQNTTEIFIPKPLQFNEVLKYDSRIIYSNAKINNSIIDGWRKFKLENYKDLDGGSGDLNKLIVNNDIMYFLQDRGFGKLSINPVSTVLDQTGTSIVLGTGSVIQDFAYVSDSLGCQNVLSAVATPKGIYWYDNNNKKAYGFRANGLESISDTHGVKSWFNVLNKDVTAVLGYDYYNSEVLFSMLDGTTIVFSDQINKFTSVYSYATSMYVSHPTTLLSLDSITNNIYEHNSGSIATWYNSTKDTKIEFIVNKNPLYPKAFDHLEWYVTNNDGLLLGLESNFDTATFRVSSPAEIITQELTAVNIDGIIETVDDFDVRENISRVPVPRNSFGERVRDTFMKVVLKVTNRTDKISLHYVKTLFRISKR